VHDQVRERGRRRGRPGGSGVRVRAIAGTVAALTIAGCGTALSSVIRRLAIAAVAPPTGATFELKILAIDETAATMTLPRTPETLAPGEYVLVARGGAWMRIGGLLAAASDRVIRRLPPGPHIGFRPGSMVHWSGYAPVDPGALGMPYDDVEIPGEHGILPAWRIPPQDGVAEPARWAVVVHGRGASRAEGLRAVPTLRAAGLGCLLVGYRNDLDAAPSPDGRVRLGESEWRDIDAAIGLLAAEGVREVVLVGFSMGGAISLQAAMHARHRGLIESLILDSPVVDWMDTFDHQARLRGMPRPVARLAEAALRLRPVARAAGLEHPLDLRVLDVPARAAELGVPVLLMHSDADLVVPSGPSIKLAGARPDLVRLVRFPDAMHTRIANAHPERWRAEVSRWVSRPSGR